MSASNLTPPAPLSDFREGGDATPPPESGQIARGAALISLGNLASRGLGFAREFAKSHYFGAGAAVSAYEVATIVPTMIYDLLIGGMVNSALVPVFSEMAARRDRGDLWRTLSAVLSLTTLVMAALVVIVEAGAGVIAPALSADLSPDALNSAAFLLRITSPAILFLSLSGVISGALYALKRFSAPAFTAAVFNACIFLAAVLLHRQMGIASMAVGLLIGAAGQVALQLPALRDARLRFRVNLRDPSLRRIALLYLPIAAGLLVDILIQRPFTYNVASHTAGDNGIPWMRYAIFLYHLPQGLVSVSISFAALPTLAAQGGLTGDREAFHATLGRALRLVAVLMIPASVGMFILARPLVALLFEHGAFTAADTVMTARALRFYLIGMPFAAVDLLLVYGFYARQDTLTPSLIGVGAVVVYLIAVALLIPALGLFSIMVGEAIKLALHTAIAAGILRRRTGGFPLGSVLRVSVLAGFASAVMGAGVYGALIGVERGIGAGAIREVAAVIVPGGVGALIYGGLMLAMRVEEMWMLIGVIRRRLLPAMKLPGQTNDVLK